MANLEAFFLDVVIAVVKGFQISDEIDLNFYEQHLGVKVGPTHNDEKEKREIWKL